MLCSEQSHWEGCEVKKQSMPASTEGVGSHEQTGVSLPVYRVKRDRQPPRRVLPSVVLFAGTQDTFLTCLKLFPTKVKLLNLGLAEYTSTMSSVRGEGNH